MPQHKAVQVLAIEPLEFRGPDQCRIAMLEGIETYCVALTGTSVGTSWRSKHSPRKMGFFMLGSHAGVRRLLCHVNLVDAPASVELSLRATKGETDVLEADWGSMGPNIGNTILVARLLHVGICVLRRQGVLALSNHPYDERSRQHYIDMGFVDGRRLSLLDPNALQRAFGYVGAVYRRFGLGLDAPPP